MATTGNRLILLLLLAALLALALLAALPPAAEQGGPSRNCVQTGAAVSGKTHVWGARP